jgi:DNA polymerase (family 10)
MKNQELAKIFDRIADILEFKGDLVFKVNAYRRAARALEGLSWDVADLAAKGELEEIPGIGRAIAEKIEEYLKTGRLSKLSQLEKTVPSALIDLLAIQGLGPKTLALLHRELKVGDRESLRKVLESGRAAQLPGMGPKKAENILKGLELFAAGQQRLFLGLAYPIAREIAELLKRKLGTELVMPAGSLRRMQETVGDIDILAAHTDGRKAVEAFVSLPLAARVLSAGETKASILTETGLQIDLRVVEEKSFGAALQYFTGSKEHNVRLREMARKKGLTLSEYGVFRLKDNRFAAGRSEEEVYAKLDLPFIPPELREDQGEIQAALDNKLPRLVEIKDIRGDLHVHSDWSDGHSSIQELAAAARKRGYSYLAICDHSPSASYAGGLTPEKLAEQIDFIKRFNAKHGCQHFRILSGCEVDVRPDGSLDLPDTLLSKLDLVVASIHSAFTKNVTVRLIRACRHPQVDIIGHPTGRLISKREGYQGLDLETVLREAAKTGTALEINSYHERLDLNDQNARRAAELGCRLAVNTDSHSAEHLWMMELGVGVARRAWLEKKHVINCLPPGKLGKKHSSVK